MGILEEHLGEDLENEPQDLQHYHYHSHPHHNPQHHHHVLQIFHLIKILSNIIQQLLLNIIKLNSYCLVYRYLNLYQGT